MAFCGLTDIHQVDAGVLLNMPWRVGHSDAVTASG
jgi:hypothetical protein